MTDSNKPVCRNCGDAQFFSHEVNAGGGLTPNLLPIGFFAGARYRIRVCGTCGLTDWFVPKEFLQGVRDTFKADD
jgi:predicted nucleic-acid-binding Zn-ribbon protein